MLDLQSENSNLVVQISFFIIIYTKFWIHHERGLENSFQMLYFPCRNLYWGPQKKCVPRVVKNQSESYERFLEGCSSHIDPMFSGYFLQFHSMLSLYFGWWNLDIQCNAHHYMYLVHQNKLMTFCCFGIKTTSFGPPSFRLENAPKKHNLCMHAIAPHHCLSPPTPHCPVPTFRFGRLFSWFFWP